MPTERILVIDDDMYIRKACTEYLTAEGYDVHAAENGEKGVEINTNKGPFDLVITDLKMPGIDGIEVLKQVKENSVKTDVIVITAHGTIENAVQAMRHGAYDYLTKTFNIDELDLVVKRCLEKRRLTTEVRELKELVNLYEASKAISSLMGLDELLNLILRLVCDTLSADGGSIMLYDPESRDLAVKAAIGPRKDDIIGKKVIIGERIAGFAAKEDKTVSIQGTLKDDPRFAHLDEFGDISSGLTMPLERKGKLLGVINLNRQKKQTQFNKRDENLLSIFAVEASIAMENNYLFNKLEQEKEELNATFASMADGAIVTDNDLKIIRMNSSAEALLGIQQKDCAGKSFGAIVGELEPSMSWDAIKGSPERITSFELKRIKGKTLYLGVRATTIADQEGNRIGRIMVLRDITSEKKEEKVKMDFLALISHKLKTPLTAIKGFSEILITKSQTEDSKLKTALVSIKKQSDLLDELVDKLLRFTLLTSEYTSLHQEKASMPVLLDKCVKGFGDWISANQAEVTIDPPVAELPPVNVDMLKIVEVFENLIENSIKFNSSKEKKTRISGKVLDDNMIVMEVTDNAAGIPPEEQAKIFKKFYQIDQFFTGQVEGVGLGLAVVKHIVELHGGKIWVESALDKGSKFSVTLPIFK
ncbi:MAG: response regulator [Endomicrobiales bacterium]|nr:response regulator [Endomicrobiales bacterium]